MDAFGTALPPAAQPGDEWSLRVWAGWRSSITLGDRATAQGRVGRCSRPGSARRGRPPHQLGIRTNRPRVYVVATPAGGTGGGMFLDMAYLARSSCASRLRQARGDRRAYAAVRPTSRRQLTPREHLCRAGRAGPLQPARHELRGAIQPAGGPGPRSRSAVPPLPVPAFARHQRQCARRQAVGLTAGLMFREVLAPLGRAADAARPAGPAAAFCYTAGPVPPCVAGPATGPSRGPPPGENLLNQWTAKDRRPGPGRRHRLARRTMGCPPTSA